MSDSFLHPHTVENLGWLAAQAWVGFLSNAAVAIYRIRIGYAALVADGLYARTDGRL